MKRIYTALSCLMLLFLLLMGLISTFDKDATYSESEKRQLKTRPKFTLSGFLDGNYFISFREYYADTFPGRENMMDSNTTLNKFYYFSGFAAAGTGTLLMNSLPLIAVCLVGCSTLPRQVTQMFARACGMYGKRRKSNDVDSGKLIYVAVRFGFICLLLWLCIVSMVGTTSTPSIYADF